MCLVFCFGFGLLKMFLYQFQSGIYQYLITWEMLLIRLGASPYLFNQSSVPGLPH